MEKIDYSYIKENIIRVQEEISQSAKASGRKPDDITLIAVTKNFPTEVIENAQKFGIRDFGENRVQEMLEKMPNFNDISWHMIGHLQTNKVKDIIGKTKLIHSVDSIKLLDEIDKQSQKMGIVSNILLEVNIAKEQSKYGFFKEEIFDALDIISQKKHVFLQGLMTVAPKVDSYNTNILHFHDMNQLYVDIKGKKYNNNIEMKYLSMGMSSDFNNAILCGANIVRIGSYIFGDRYKNIK